MTLVAPRILNDVSYVRRGSIMGLFCVAGAVFGKVGL